MKYLFAQIPSMIDVVLQKATDLRSNKERPEIAAAREKLIGKLRRINAEIKTYSEQEGDGIVQQKENQQKEEDSVKAAIERLNEYKKPKQMSFPFIDD